MTFTFPVEQSLFQTVLYADDGLTVGDHAVVRARHGQVGNAARELTVGNDVQFGDASHSDVVSLFSGAATALGQRVHITGGLQSGEPVRQKDNVVVDLGIVSKPLATPRSFTITAEFTAPVEGIHLGPRAERTLNPGAYNELYLASDSAAHLRTGRYYLAGDLRVGANSTLDVDDTAGEVVVFVGGSVGIEGQTALRKGPQRFAIVVLGSGSVDLSTAFRGTILAPSGDIRVSHEGSEGALFGQRLALQPNATVKLSASKAGRDCYATRLSGRHWWTPAPFRRRARSRLSAALQRSTGSCLATAPIGMTSPSRIPASSRARATT
jgi:hypothetical protein